MGSQPQLAEKHLEHHLQSSVDISTVSQVLERSLTRSGKSVVEMSSDSPVLLVFLRHAGCTFCRETLQDIARVRLEIEQGGTRIVLVHMSDSNALDKLLLKYDLSQLDRICDPGQDLYRAFGLKRGTFRQLFGWKVFRRGFLEGVLARYGAGPVLADASQMPGIFLIDNCAIVSRFRHGTAADRPDYLRLFKRD